MTEQAVLTSQQAPTTEPVTKTAKVAAATGETPIELVFGLVGPSGVNLDSVVESLKNELKAANYVTHLISLSDALLNYDDDSSNFINEYERTTRLMDKGDDLRRRSGNPAIVGLLGIYKIRAYRESLSGDFEIPDRTTRVAYIVRSFKRSEEVSLYRDIYGKAFTLISVYSARMDRIANLTRRCEGFREDGRSPEELAMNLINRDYREEDKDYGQQVGNTFPLADYFVTTEHRIDLGNQLKRLVRLTFGDPYISPSRDEQGMFFAQAAALRSLDLSRQVGAAVTSREGDILTTGCNEVPAAGGGLYWEDSEGCQRDFERGNDANVSVKLELLNDVVQRLRGTEWLTESASSRNNESLVKEMLSTGKLSFDDSKLFDVIEFGRSVHAEMAAISHAARLGISLQGSRLFCTTFPCHICARHIVASGISEVVFIEPYEKSRTKQLFSDSISVEPHEMSPRKVNFRSFVGVSPRRYIDYFQLTTKRKNKSGSIRSPEEIAQNPRIKRITFTYTMAETKMIDIMPLPQKVVSQPKELS